MDVNVSSSVSVSNAVSVAVNELDVKVPMEVVDVTEVETEVCSKPYQARSGGALKGTYGGCHGQHLTHCQLDSDAVELAANPGPQSASLVGRPSSAHWL